MKHCPRCGGELSQTMKRQYSLLDVVGAAVVGSMVLGLIGMFLSLSHVGKGFSLAILLGGTFAVGLYHMLGYKQVKRLECRRCGVVCESVLRDNSGRVSSAQTDTLET